MGVGLNMLTLSALFAFVILVTGASGDLLEARLDSLEHQLVALRSKYSQEVAQLRAENKKVQASLAAANQGLGSPRSAICAYNSYYWDTVGPVLYDSVTKLVEDVGSSLNETTGIYTAGVSGVYLITGSGECRTEPDESVTLIIKRNNLPGEVNPFINSYNNGNLHTPFEHHVTVREQCAGAWLLELAEGDTMYVQFAGDGSVYGLRFCVPLYAALDTAAV